MITLLSGAAMGYRLVKLGLGVRLGEPGIVLMQTCGTIGALMVLALALPTTRKLARLAVQDPLPPEFERLRKRQAALSSVAGILGLLALIGATLI